MKNSQLISISPFDLQTKVSTLAGCHGILAPLSTSAAAYEGQAIVEVAEPQWSAASLRLIEHGIIAPLYSLNYFMVFAVQVAEDL